MKTITSIKLPRSVCEYLIDDLDESLNTMFPKMFFSIRIKKRRLKFKIPSKVNIRSIIIISDYSKLHYNKFNYEFRVVLPRIGKDYTLFYDDRERSVTCSDGIGGLMV